MEKFCEEWCSYCNRVTNISVDKVSTCKCGEILVPCSVCLVDNTICTSNCKNGSDHAIFGTTKTAKKNKESLDIYIANLKSEEVAK